MGIAVKFFGGGTLLLLLFLLGGFLLPKTWEVERTVTMAAPAEALHAYLDRPEGWERWTPWPDAGAVRAGPDRGVGAQRGWDDPEWGSGLFTLTGETPGRGVTYRVEVEDGSLVTEGAVELEPRGDSTRVRWVERGDFGWNPILGYVTRFMDRLQGRVLDDGLARLRELAEDGPSAIEGEASSAPDPVSVAPRENGPVDAEASTRAAAPDGG